MESSLGLGDEHLDASMLSSSRSGSCRPNIQAGHNLLHRPGLSPVSLHGVFPYPRHRSSSIHSIPVFSNNQGVALLADGPFSRDVTTTPDATPRHSSPTPLIHNRRGRLSINYTGLCSEGAPCACLCPRPRQQQGRLLVQYTRAAVGGVRWFEHGRRAVGGRWTR